MLFSNPQNGTTPSLVGKHILFWENFAILVCMVSFSFVQRLAKLAMTTFFRRIEVNGLENIPSDRGGLVIAWHPNGMIDPGLIFAFFPKKLVFGARHGLFSWPILSTIMRDIGTVPIYRAEDNTGLSANAQKEANQQSLQQLAETMQSGAFAALFPEGISHDAPFVQQLKTGAARMYYQAIACSTSSQSPVIIPVGIHYDCKQRFRSDVLINFHPPIALPKHIQGVPSPEEEKQRYKELTDIFEQTLTDIVFSTESWELHRNFHRASLLVRAERLSLYANKKELHQPTMEEKVIGLARIWQGYQHRKQDMPKLVEEMVADVQQYRLDMEALGLSDVELDHNPQVWSLRLVGLFLFQLLLYGLVLPPLVFIGYIMNMPTHLLVSFLAENYSSKYKDKASVRLFSAVVLYPLTWILWGIAGYFGYTKSVPFFPNLPDIPISAGLLSGSLAILGCVLMFVYARTSRRIVRAWKIRFIKRQNKDYIAHLLSERKRLAEMLFTMSADLELPGIIGKDNKLSWNNSSAQTK